MKLAESVLFMATIARLASQSLRAGKTESQIHDLAHGPVELLREVFLQIHVQEEHQQLASTVKAITGMLLLLRGLLLEWDCTMCSDTVLELPLQKLPKHYPNRCWRLKHPKPNVWLSEVQACIQFLQDNADSFQGEPWLWMEDCLSGLALSFDH